MKATELRIGNLVTHNYREDEVFSLSGFILYKLTVTENTGDELFCKPITLTEEWLLRFNFKPYCYLFNGELLTGYIPFNLFFHEENTYIVQKYESKYYVMTNGENRQIVSDGFEYVHQLQNIFFALTQKELNINSKQHTP